MQHSHGLHHLHKRRQAAAKVEKNILKYYMDHVIYVAIFASPILTIPQITQIWIYHQTEGISIITWTTYFITSVLWLMYSSVHKDKILILTYLIWVFVNGMIVLGLLLY